ncbi:MAG: helix-turn-helix transcriptional regulator [Flavobacteriaceae bacterium]|nr:helix-turn-helix transcriptional regulator [Flavobacteriaceae bacterium]
MNEHSESYVPYDSDKVFREINCSLRSSRNWALSREDWPEKNLDVAHSKKRDNKASLSIRTEDISEYQVLPESIISKCNKLVGKLGDEATDLFIIVKYLWALKSKKNTDFVQLSLDEIAPLLGYSKTKRGGYASYVKRKILELMELLSFLYLDTELEIWGFNETGKKIKVTHCKKGKILVFDSFEKTTYEVLGEKKKTSYSWLVKPGSVISPLLQDPNKMFAHIDRKVLAYRSTGQIFTKRIGDACSWYFRVNFRKELGAFRITIRSLLESCFLLTDGKNPGRTVEKFSEAIEVLRKDNIVKSIVYEDSSILDLIAKKPKGYYEQWLDSMLKITPPDKLSLCYTPMIKSRKESKKVESKKVESKKVESKKVESNEVKIAEPSFDDMDDSLKQLINIIHYDAKFTVTHFAQILGVSRPYLSMVIRGKKPASKGLLEKIRLIME